MHAIPGAAHDVRVLLQAFLRNHLQKKGSRVVLGFVVGVLLLRLPWAYPLPRAIPWLVGSMGLLVAGVLCWARAAPRPGLLLPFLVPFLVPIGAGVLGYGWGSWQVGRALDARLPNCVDAVPRGFEIEILDEPVLDAPVPSIRVARFSASVRIPGDPACPGLDRHRLRLSWYDPPELLVGQRWQVQGRLRPPWGYRNGAGFDYERWLLGQGLNGTGYVGMGQLVAQASAERPAFASLRTSLRLAIEQRRLERGEFLLALMIGDDSGISASDWQTLRESGTVHLLVISGLHVGMIAGLLFQIGRLVARLCPPLLLVIGSRRAASILALTGSAAYVWLAGAGVPAVRAWLMSAMLLLFLSAGRSIGLSRVLMLVLAVTLLGNPLVVHQQGFWLSFAAVFSLLAYFEPKRWSTAPSRPARALWSLRQLLTVQLVLFLALAPLLATEQSSVPVAAPLVNACVVPVLTFLILPLVLFAGVFLAALPALADPLLNAADHLLGWVMATATLGAGVEGLAMGVGGPAEWALLALALALLGCAPGRRGGALLAALWWAVLLPDGVGPRPGTFRVTALDVGQGSAIVVETGRHRLLYDTGAVYPSGFDLGAAVVVPNLRRAIDPRLDALILSHDDVDHTGGARSVDRALTPKRIWTSFAPDPGTWAADRTQYCRQGVSWMWDGVRFRFLHPPATWRGSDNDGSCVLLIESSRRRALLAGDVSSRVERRLPKLPVDLAFAPHHGSATSSSASYVRGYRPRIVFISTDRRSRYGHPHPDVLARYAGTRVFVTGRDGELRWESDRPMQVERARSASSAYWHSHWSVPPKTDWVRQ